MTTGEALDEDAKRARVATTGWYHSIDLGDGVVTPGLSKNQIDEALLPDPTGRDVLDIGAWDGFYSYWAERRGARRVVAMDHYVWGVDIVAREAYWRECAARGELPDHTIDVERFWNDDLPGKRGFDIAHDILDSKVEAVVGNFLDAEPAVVGTFDIVLFLGVLYHMKDPLRSLEQVRRLTTRTAVIETEAIALLEHENEALCEFIPGGAMNEDYGNWYALSETAVVAMCQAAGFRTVDVKRDPPPPVPEPAPIIWRSSAQDRANHFNTQRDRRQLRRYRIVAHAHV
jgi:tRNA (mo5U34)-methyltransferase